MTTRTIEALIGVLLASVVTAAAYQPAPTNETTPLLKQRGLTTCSMKENEMADEIVAVEVREVEGFIGYGVSADGRTWSRHSRGGARRGGVPAELLSTWRELRQGKDGGGHPMVCFKGRCKQTSFLVHRLVLTAFVGPRPDGMHCCHWDGNILNNHLINLRWDTPKNNNADKHRHGTANTGERNRWAKLTEHQVIEIRRLAADGRTYVSLSRQFGVVTSAINNIVNRRRWKHIA